MTKEMGIGEALGTAIDVSHEQSESFDTIFDKEFERKMTRIFDYNFTKLAHGKQPAKTVVQRYPKGEVVVKLAPIKATIYKSGEMMGGAPRGIEVKSLNYAIAPYAQFPKALHMYYIPKGKVNARHLVDSDSRSTVIVEGWGHPAELGATYHAPEDRGSVTITRGRYLSHDPRYHTEASDFLKEYLRRTGAKVIVDVRR